MHFRPCAIDRLNRARSLFPDYTLCYSSNWFYTLCRVWWDHTASELVCTFTHVQISEVKLAISILVEVCCEYVLCSSFRMVVQMAVWKKKWVLSFGWYIYILRRYHHLIIWSHYNQGLGNAHPIYSTNPQCLGFIKMHTSQYFINVTIYIYERMKCEWH